MRIDGRAIADGILTNLAQNVDVFKKRSVTPTLAVILVGNDQGSLSYIKQKQRAAERIGARVIFEHMPRTYSQQLLLSAVAHFNNDPTVHGLIIQRPVPSAIGDVKDILISVSPTKDVDGFLPGSAFEVPVARAILTILARIHTELRTKQLIRNDFKSWLTAQSIAIVGRGESAGKPIADALKKYDCTTSIIHSQTTNPKPVLKGATIIISCVGRQNIIKRTLITRGVMLISVGIWRDNKGKLHGDYEEEDIKDFASFYTPTPGGVGPINVACLMQNLIEAATLQISSL